MDSVKSPTLDAMLRAVTTAATEAGDEAGHEFVQTWKLGTNRKVDTLFREGVRSNASIIVQRFPWAAMAQRVLAGATVVGPILVGIGVDPDSLDSEVMDEVIETYLREYDNASRKVILVAVSHGKDTN